MKNTYSIGKKRAKENGESMGHWKRWTPFFQKIHSLKKRLIFSLEMPLARNNIGQEVFFASKYRKWIEFQQPLPLSDL